MDILFNKTWKPLIDKEMCMGDLRCAANVQPNTMTMFHRDQPVNLATLCRCCAV